jgi:four helix bundle protein
MHGTGCRFAVLSSCTFPFPFPFPILPENTPVTSFDHEKLDVYKLAIDFLALADDIVERLPRGRAVLADQLQRASISIPLNVAEGAGEFSPKDKKRFYRMALRSATECAAILDVCRRLNLAEEALLASGRDHLLRIVSMLTRLARRSDEAGTGTGTGTSTGRGP